MGDLVGGDDASAGKLFHQLPALRRRQCYLLAGRGGLLGAQLLHDRTCIDANRAGDRAGAVGGAHVDGVVLILLLQLRQDLRAFFLSGHFSAQDDALARGHRGMTGGADGLAEATLHARVDLVFDLGEGFEVAQVDGLVARELHVRCQDSLGIDHVLDLPEQLEGLRTPLVLQEGRHVHAGAMLSLHRALVLINDQLGQIIQERGIGLAFLLNIEARGEEEVQVAKGRVAHD